MEKSSGIIVAGLLAALIAGGLFVFFSMHGRAHEDEITIVGQARPSKSFAATALPDSKATAAKPDQAVPVQAPPAEVVVHVVGAVKKPGVYHFKPGTRVEVAVSSAGGATGDANLSAINLAAQLNDGSQVHVPTKKESAATVAPDSGSDAYVKSGAAGNTHHPAARSGKFSQPGKEFVNINTASEEQLQRLPGVGPAMAARIMQHRKESGPFSDPEQLQDVSGIGPKKYEKMRPFVKVR